MKKALIPVSLFALLLAGSLIALSCGGSQSQSQLQSMSVSPTTADAKDYPNGQVQFTTTGYYENPTRTVTPQSATWVACQNDTQANDVTVTATGVAQCGTGASGSFTIDAWNPVGKGMYNCPAYSACGSVPQCSIQAVAQLICP